MSPSAPPRKFAPEPIETSQKSSRQQSPSQQEEEKKPKSRRFAPEPVETSIKSSRSTPQQSPERGGPRKFAPEPVETSSRKSSAQYRQSQIAETGELKPRKFAVQPVETTKKSSQDRKQSTENGKDKPPPRRFAPQLMETTSSQSSKDGQDMAKPKSKFSPQPMETTFNSNRKTREKDQTLVPDIEIDEEPKPPRKFAPVLIDTAARTRKAKGSKPVTIANKLRTELGYEIHAAEARKHMGHNEDEQSHVTGSGDGGVILTSHGGEGHMAAAQSRFRDNELKASSADHRRMSSSSMRSHSFRMPDLDTIESSESDRDSSSSSSVAVSPTQGSPLTTSDSSYQEVYKHATRIRESIDENFSQYLLQLEAKRMEARMQEQALAAFPNSDFHEPVQHYVDEDKESDEMELDDRPTTWEGHEEFSFDQQQRGRRESTVNWEQLEMQKHAERMSQDRKANAPLNRETTNRQSQSQTHSPWWNDGSDVLRDPNNNYELKQMQQGARPPMLGSDLRFPRCPSPEPARFDVTQGSTKIRSQMCYLSEMAEASQQNSLDTDEQGLWAGRSPQSTQSSSAGLWNGFCLEESGAQTPNGTMAPTGGLLAPPSGPTGLMTPRVEKAANPFDSAFAVPGAVQEGPGLHTPPTAGTGALPPPSQLDTVLAEDKALDTLMQNSYPDTFITQVFNYLSLGYPTLARRFDDELAKISRVPVEELRQDDETARKRSKGYIRLGQDFEGQGMERGEESTRWRALRLYVREWARQEKDMVNVEDFAGFGAGARRGSWAL